MTVIPATGIGPSIVKQARSDLTCGDRSPTMGSLTSPHVRLARSAP